MLFIDEMNLTESEIYDAVRRGYSELSDSSDAEIVDYFSNVDNISHHISHIKGIALEMELDRNIENSVLFELTNHEGTDIIIDGTEYSVKSGVSVQPTLDDLSEGLEVIATSEIADVTEAIDAGMTNLELVQSVLDALF
jgi:hypothetical protein